MVNIQNVSSTESKRLIREFLRERSSGVLASADAAGNPHAAVVYFVPEDGYTILFATKRETQKYKNIEANNNVAFAIYDEVLQIAIQIMGHVEVVQEESLRESVLSSMVEKSASISGRETPPPDKLSSGDYAILRLFPLVIKMSIFARSDYDGDDIYETILFNPS